MSEKKNVSQPIKVSWIAWLSLALLLIMVSGAFKDSDNFMAAFDFTNLMGKFGGIFESVNFLGKGGSGAKEGFLQALNIAPVVILFCLPLLDAAVSMWIMRIILMITGIQ